MAIGTLVLSDFVNPEYGISFPVEMQFEWSTDIRPKGRLSQRNEEWSQPRRHWFIDWPALSVDSRNKLQEIFNRARGSSRTFLWWDRDDFLCSGEQIATDGSAATYQLCKSYYPAESESWTEDKKAIMPGDVYQPVVTHSVDGAQTETQVNPPANANEYYLDDTTGIMTWKSASPPSAGILTVTFQFYFRVRWTFDLFKDVQFAPGWWKMANSGPHIMEDE